MEGHFQKMTIHLLEKVKLLSDEHSRKTKKKLCLLVGLYHMIFKEPTL